MKGLFMSLEREFRLIFRNGITIYLVIAPALLSLVFLLVFGGMRSSSVAFAVDASVPREIASRLETVAELEYFDDRESLIRRVGGTDSLAGLSAEDGRLRLIVEGNEPEGFAVSRRSLVAAVLDLKDITYNSEIVEGKNSLAYDISMTCIFLLALFIGGATLGLGGVSERESGVIRAILISPMTLFGYILTKLLPALLSGVVGVAACAWIMGGSGSFHQYVLMAVGSVFVSGIIAFLIISFADNQIAAVGVLKIVMPVFLVVGISAALVPEKLLALYYPVPMYWQYASLRAIGAGEPPAFPILMIVLTGLPWFLAVMAIFKKKMNFRVWR